MAQTSIEIRPDGSFPLSHFVDEVVENQAFPGAHLIDIVTEAQILNATQTPGFSKVGRRIMLTAEGRQQLETRLEGFSDPGAVREDGTGMLFNRRSPDPIFDESQQIKVESLPWEAGSIEIFPESRPATSLPRQGAKNQASRTVSPIDIPPTDLTSIGCQLGPPLEEFLVGTRKANSVSVRYGPNQRAPAVAVLPFNKKGERVLASEESIGPQGKYPFPALYLGSLFHHGVQRELAGKGPLPMLDYLLHLDKLGDHHLAGNDPDPSTAERLSKVGLARTVLEKTSQVSGQVVDEINRNIPEEYNPVAWLSEVPFVTTNRQTEVIARSLENKDLQDFASAVFDADLYQLGERVISSPDPRLVIRDGRSTREVTLTDIYKMALDSEKTEGPSYLHKLCDYLGAISGYYMLNNTGFSGEAMNIPEPFKKLILCASARCDLIGLMNREGKRQPQTEDLIAEFVERTRGRLFGRRPLHDFVHTSSEAIDVQRRLVEAIIKGDVAVWVGEIKAHLTKQEESDFYQDLAHTVFAGMQSLTRSLNHPISFSDRLSDMVSLRSRGQKKRIQPDLLIKLMSAPSEEREAVLLGLRPFMRILEPPNAFFGIEINWPGVVDSDSAGSKPLFGLDPRRVVEIDPEWRFFLLNPRVLRRFVAEKGNDFLGRLMES